MARKTKKVELPSENLAFVWNLWGELIDYALEQMADDPDQSYTSVRWEHYIAALTGAGAWHAVIGYSPPITK